MLSRDFWRSPQWHKATNEFIISGGPSVTNTTTVGFTVSWQLSEAGSGQLEYGTTTAYGSTTTEEPVSSGLRIHAQTVDGLDQATTYHYRVKSTSAAGVTVYSTDQTVTTAGEVPTPTVGPRYDLYGDGASGTFPTFPSGGNVVLVDSTVPTDRECSAELSAFLSDTTKVPNGSVGTPTIVVFDTSENGQSSTDYGAGTEYVLDRYVEISNTVAREYIQLWGYNCRFSNSHVSGDYAGWARGVQLFFRQGFWSNLDILGFTFLGGNSNAGTIDCRVGISEYNHALYFLAGTQDIAVQDCYFTMLAGDAMYWPNGWGTNSPLVTPKLGAPTGMEFSYNHVYGTGRQNIANAHGVDFYMHHNFIDAPAFSCYNQEDDAEIAMDSGDIVIVDNHFRHWAAWIAPDPASAVWIDSCVFIGCPTSWVRNPPTNVTVSRNVFTGGPLGWGNPAAEALRGSTVPQDGYGPTIIIGIPNDAKQFTNVIVEDNVIDYSECAWYNVNRAHPDWTHCGNAVTVANANGLTISGNDFGDRGVYYRATGSVTVEDIDGIVNSA